MSPANWGAVDPAAAARYAAEVSVAPIVLRDIAPTGAISGSFFSADVDLPVMVTSKPGEDDGWVALRLQNLSREDVIGTIDFTVTPSAARAADPVEHLAEALALSDKRLAVDLKPLEIRTVLVRFAKRA